MIVLWLAAVVGGIALFLLYALAKEQTGGTPAGARRERMRACPNFEDGRFLNTHQTSTLYSGGLFATFRMIVARAERWPRKAIPTMSISSGFFSQAPAGGLRVTWLGHSTFVIELDGALILTDPALYSRASPFPRTGPKRFFASPADIRDLPALDAVVISHDHYDHLAMDEIRALEPRTKRFIVPLGIGAHLERWRVPSGKIVELYWWEESVIGDGVRVIATPARHFSGRGFLRDQTLWASIALVGPAHRVFCCGDTGMTDEFSEVGRRFGPFDCSLINIGAYGPSWPDIHLSPEEALKVHSMVRGKALIPSHWATYALALHSWHEPADRLIAAASGTGVSLIMPIPGQPVLPDSLPPLVRWWDACR